MYIKLQVAVVQSLELLCLTTLALRLLSSLSNQPGEYSIETFLSATSTLESMTRVSKFGSIISMGLLVLRIELGCGAKCYFARIVNRGFVEEIVLQ